MRGQLLQTTDGGLLCDFPERMFLIANHQIYTDWLYLWWIGYAAGMHGRIYVVLKESLKSIPVIGWGMQFAQFIFLKRKWEDDKPRLAAHMQRFNNSDPMWLMMFPEGTNLASCTREISRKWAEKNGIKDMQHTLLPRSTGLHFMLKELRSTVEYVYDCTIAYEGVPRGQFAQDIFTVGASYFGGRPPKSVNMYWRRFRVADIPLNDAKLFDVWLRARWTEKDKFIEHYYRKGHFPADTGSKTTASGKTLTGAGYIESEVKPKRWYEFLQVFAPIGLFSLVLYFFYGALPQEMVEKVKTIDQKALMGHLDAIQKGKMKIPETKDLMATAPKHLQNRFDAVKKLAEVRGTTPEKVIAQLQTANTDNLGEKAASVLKASSIAPASTAVANKGLGHPTGPKATPKLAGLSSQKPASKPTRNASNTPTAATKPGSSAGTIAPSQKPTPSVLPQQSKPQGEPSGSKTESKKPSGTSAASSKAVPEKKGPPTKTPQAVKSVASPNKAANLEKVNGTQTSKEDVRKARKKLELRQGKQQPMRKTRRAVEASKSNG